MPPGMRLEWIVQFGARRRVQRPASLRFSKFRSRTAVRQKMHSALDARPWRDGRIGLRSRHVASQCPLKRVAQAQLEMECHRYAGAQGLQMSVEHRLASKGAAGLVRFGIGDQCATPLPPVARGPFRYSFCDRTPKARPAVA